MTEKLLFQVNEKMLQVTGTQCDGRLVLVVNFVLVGTSPMGAVKLLTSMSCRKKWDPSLIKAEEYHDDMVKVLIKSTVLQMCEYHYFQRVVVKTPDHIEVIQDGWPKPRFPKLLKKSKYVPNFRNHTTITSSEQGASVSMTVSEPGRSWVPKAVIQKIATSTLRTMVQRARDAALVYSGTDTEKKTDNQSEDDERLLPLIIEPEVNAPDESYCCCSMCVLC